MSNATEHALWEIVENCGPVWWWVIAALAAWCLLMMYRLIAPVTAYGRAHRILMMMGLFLIAFSPFNSAFGPFGVPLVLLGLRGMLRQMYDRCVSEGKITPATGNLGQRLYHWIIHEPRLHR